MGQEPELIQALIAVNSNQENVELINNFLAKPGWSKHPNTVQSLLHKKDLLIDRALVNQLQGNDEWKKAQPEIIKELDERKPFTGDLVRLVLSKPVVKNRQFYIKKILDNISPEDCTKLVEDVLSRPDFINDHADMILAIINDSPHVVAKDLIFTKILSNPSSKTHPEFVKAFMKQPHYLDGIINKVLPQAHWAYPELMEELMKIASQSYYKRSFLLSIAEKLLSDPAWKDPEVVKKLINENDWKINDVLIKSTLKQPFWADHPELVELLLKKDPMLARSISEEILTQPGWKDNKKLKLLVIAKNLQNSRFCQGIYNILK
jgi:hypothetical protein